MSEATVTEATQSTIQPSQQKQSTNEAQEYNPKALGLMDEADKKLEESEISNSDNRKNKLSPSNDNQSKKKVKQHNNDNIHNNTDNNISSAAVRPCLVLLNASAVVNAAGIKPLFDGKWSLKPQKWSKKDKEKIANEIRYAGAFNCCGEDSNSIASLNQFTNRLEREVLADPKFAQMLEFNYKPNI